MALVIHDLECSQHGYMPNELIDNNIILLGIARCPRGSDHDCKIVYNKVARAVGILPSRPEVSNQLGVTFETNQQKRDYMRDNPNVIEFSKGDILDKQIGQRSAERADKSARAFGYRSEDHRREEVRTALSKGWKPRSEKPSPR